MLEDSELLVISVADAYELGINLLFDLTIKAMDKQASMARNEEYTQPSV